MHRFDAQHKKTLIRPFIHSPLFFMKGHINNEKPWCWHIQFFHRLKQPIY